MHFDTIPQRMVSKTYKTTHGHKFEYATILGGTRHRIKMHYHLIELGYREPIGTSGLAYQHWFLKYVG